VDHAATLAGLESRPCPTLEVRIHGWDEDAGRHGDLAVYGADAPAVAALIASHPALGERLHPSLPVRAGEVVWAVRHEMARAVEDFLARRSRALFLDARAALEMAPRVAALMAAELGHDERWQAAQLSAFAGVAAGYIAG
jgi:glycerol-3-phosphate dehydrogenase